MCGKRPRATDGWRRVAVAIAWVTCVVVWPDSARALEWTRVLGSGDPAPGFIDGTQVGSFRRVAPRLADDGTVSFTVGAGGGFFFAFPVEVLYRSSPAAPPERLALASGFLFGGNSFASFDDLEANRAGDIVLLGLRPESPSPCGAASLPSHGEFAAVYSRDGTHRVVAESFLPVPGLAAEWVGGFSCLFARPMGDCFPGPSFRAPTIRIADDGGVAFTADVASDACTAVPIRSVFGPDGNGSEQLVALAGDPAPGAPVGVGFGSRWMWSERSSNASGQLAIRAALDDESQALYRWDPGAGLTLLVRTGDPSAIAGEIVFSNLSDAALDADGTPAFFAADPDASPGSIGFPGMLPRLNSLWGPDEGGGVRRFATVGAPAPGAPDGSVFAPFDLALSPLLEPVGTPFVDTAGEVAVTLPVDVPNLGVVPAVFGPDEDGAFTMRMLGSGLAPGAAGMTLGTLEVIGFSDDLEILIRARIHPDGQPEQTEFAWYLLEPGGAARLLLRESDPLEIVPGEAVPVNVPSLHANADLSAFAVIATILEPQPKSALFVAQVPEPDGVTTSTAALLALSWLARRRRSVLRSP